MGGEKAYRGEGEVVEGEETEWLVKFYLTCLCAKRLNGYYVRSH